MAAVGAVGFVLTAIAAVTLAVTDVTRLGRWVALAALVAAALTDVVTTVIFVSLLTRRRAYIANVKAVTSRLKSRGGMSTNSPYFKRAESLHDQAIERGEEGLAARVYLAGPGSISRHSRFY